MSFLDLRNPEWSDLHEKWAYSWLSYTGGYIDQDKITGYLHKKVQAETDAAYDERKDTADPALLFPTAVDSLNGILFSKSEDTHREWGAFGDPEKQSSVAYQLLHNADGKGTNWVPLMKKAGIRQTVQHKLWALVDGIKENEDGEQTGEASIKLIDPTSVVNWYPNEGMPKEVLVIEKKDSRSSLQDKDGQANEVTYVHYTVDGWTRYVRGYDKNDNATETVIGQGEYNFYADVQRSERILPIFPVEVPMPRHIGYLLSKKQNSVFNMESMRDFSVRNTSFAWLKLVADENQYQAIIEEIKKGFRVLRQDPEVAGTGHEYISPPADHLSEVGEILEKKKEAFMESAFRSYGDAARQVTATEIRQESRSGVEAFLTLLVSSIDEFENHCFWLLEQIYFPDDTSRWGQASVQRSTDFQPKDVSEALEKASTTVERADRAGAMSLEQKVRTLHEGWSDEEIAEEVSRIKQESGMPVNNAEVG